MQFIITEDSSSPRRMFIKPGGDPYRPELLGVAYYEQQESYQKPICFCLVSDCNYHTISECELERHLAYDH